MLVYNPTAPSRNRPREPTHSLGSLSGKTVGFIDNAKPNFNFLVEDLAELLVARYGVKAVVKRAKRGPSMPAPEAIVAEIASECDLVITGSGD